MLTAVGRAGRRSLLTLAAAAAVAVAVAAPARADAVRNAQLWVLNAINVQSAWRVTEGQHVTVAVIDSGVDPDVSDLAGSVTTGPDFTGVGTPESDPNWGLHGTWMASLVAGHGHGVGSGILGAAPRAHVLSIRVITDRADPGYARYDNQPQARIQRELANAIRYAVSHHAGVISMSLGYGTASRPVRSALQDAFQHRDVVVASSGNSGNSTSARSHGHAPYSFPADYPGVLGVGAVSQDGAPARFSSDNLSVEVAAPGVRVPAQGRDGQYWLVSGTSPACALVAGVAALVRSAYPGLPPPLVRQAIITTTSNRPSGGYDNQVGFGTVNAAAALSAAARLSAASRHAARRRGVSAAGHFGGGPAAVPAPPVAPRGSRTLVLLSLLAALCLAIMVTGMSRLVRVRQRSAEPGFPQPGFPQPGFPQPGFPQPGFPQPGPPVTPPEAPGDGPARAASGLDWAAGPGSPADGGLPPGQAPPGPDPAQQERPAWRPPQ